MSGGIFCRCEPPNRKRWRVGQRQCNHSAFNGYHETPSAYSSVRCLDCRSSWRTKAAYVDELPDLTERERFA